VVDIDDDEQGGEDTSQNCLVCLQIIGSKQDDDEKEIQENELVRDEIMDGEDAEQDQEGIGLFRILNEVVFESFHFSLYCRHWVGITVNESTSGAKVQKK